MAMMRTAVSFDSARLLSADLTSGTAVVKSSIMYNIPSDNALDWENIHRNDLVYHKVMAHPDRPVSFHSATLFAAPQHAIMRDYAARYEHQNGLVMQLPDADSGFIDGLSFYRANADAHFGRQEQRLIHVIMPHLQETLKLNCRLAQQLVDTVSQGALLIASTDGNVQHCDPQTQRLLHAEWSDWRGIHLPATLVSALSQPGAKGYVGKRIEVTFRRVNSMLFLRLTARSQLSSLSPRELEVASLYGKGKPAKVIAAQLGIAPVTVRNLLQKVYEKLDVHDKASLANLVAGRLS